MVIYNDNGSIVNSSIEDISFMRGFKMFNMYKGKAPCHIFLTGEKQVGKSTLVSKVLTQTDIKYSGLKSVSVFYTTGCSFITPNPGTELLVIDEIGRMEEGATDHINKILSLIERTDIRILGVIQNTADENLVAKIKNNPNVKTFVVKESNRDRLVPVVKRLLNFDII